MGLSWDNLTIYGIVLLYIRITEFLQSSIINRKPSITPDSLGNAMFFFIAGIQPKTVSLLDQPRRCPSCGLFQARLKRIDHYLSVFFIPLFRVKKGEAIIECRGCGSLSHESGAGPRERLRKKCPYCDKMLESAFRFCPHCGKRIA